MIGRHSGSLRTRAIVALNLRARTRWNRYRCSLAARSNPAREMLTEMNPRDGKMSRAWNLYTAFIGRSQGYRGSVMHQL
jgi:hypothetical protein